MASQANDLPQRRVVYFAGRVQGVGFRYMTEAFAKRSDVRGYVQNLADGRVRLVAEGMPQTLDRFLSALHNEMQRCIQSVETQVTEASGEFDDFEIRR